MSVQTIRIGAGRGYDVTVGAGLISGCGDTIRAALGECRAAVVTDSNVEKLWLPGVLESLRSAGVPAVSHAFPAGEASKRIGTLSDILEFLAESRLTRRDAVIALGGGVTGDMAGFAAGCYMRGIRYVQMPTTLLAAVDSSVGGKTAIDLAAGKNLAGLFLQPEAVICDTDALATLPADALADGMAEAVKTGVLMGEPLFSILEAGKASASLSDVIALCVAYKGKIVEEDEFEAGVRRTLNLGHTVGHAVELLSGYTVTHGRAVAAGTAVMARASARLGLGSAEAAARIERTLLRCGLPVNTDYSADELAEAALADKKRAGGGITVVIPEEIGRCVLRSIPVSDLRGVIEAGLEAL